MRQNLKYYCIIPARAGSKRLKNKNILKLNKKPIISYPINEARKSKIFKSIIVSTDSVKIKRIAEKYGATAPFLRSKILSNDQTFPINVLIDVIKKMKIKDEYVFFVYPCNPTIKKKYLFKALKIIKKDKADCLFVAEKFSNHPLRSFVMKDNNYFNLKWKNFEHKNTQHLKDFYHDTGMFYIYRTKMLLKNKKTFPKKTTALILKKYSTIDINDIEDFNFTKKLFK